jgi:hypothetical protein
LIYDRACKLGALDQLDAIARPHDWSTSLDGGPRKVVREDQCIAGLGPKAADGSGIVSWSWTVGSRTTPGSWPVTVTCTAAGATSSATAYLVVA